MPGSPVTITTRPWPREADSRAPVNVSSAQSRSSSSTHQRLGRVVQRGDEPVGVVETQGQLPQLDGEQQAPGVLRRIDGQLNQAFGRPVDQPPSTPTVGTPGP